LDNVVVIGTATFPVAVASEGLLQRCSKVSTLCMCRLCTADAGFAVLIPDLFKVRSASKMFLHTPQQLSLSDTNLRCSVNPNFEALLVIVLVSVRSRLQYHLRFQNVRFNIVQESFAHGSNLNATDQHVPKKGVAAARVTIQRKATMQMSKTCRRDFNKKAQKLPEKKPKQ